MHVLHAELPRELSFTLRPWRAEQFATLAREGVGYRQADLNLPFWRTLLDDPSCDRVQRLLDMPHQGSGYNARLVADVAARVARFQVPGGRLALRGLVLDAAIAEDSRALHAWATSDLVQACFRPWLLALEPRLAGIDLLSLGVGSPDELGLAGVLAEHVRRTRPELHVCLSAHRWENFALAPRLERLVREGALLDLVDSVVLREDRTGPALAGLCRALATGDLRALDCTAVRVDGKPHLAGVAAAPLVTRPAAVVDDAAEDAAVAHWLSAVQAPPGRLLVLEALVRNDCHYGKCTFCVQNVGYPARQQYKMGAELERSLGNVRRLGRHGVRNFSFIDQAAHPALLEAVCTALETDPIPVRWCTRMLPELAMGLPDTLLQRLARAGCADILVGLESTDATTLRAMGKSHAFDGEGAHRWLARCAELGLDVTLSAMRAFPTETDEAFAAGTGAFLRECERRHAHASIILNRFALFEGSAMAHAPSDFGLREVHRGAGDLLFPLGYTDMHGRTHDSGGEAPDDPVTHVHYGSIGLLYRWQTRRSLRADLAADRPGDPFPASRDTLVLGATGYLGRALCAALPATRLVLAGRAPGMALALDAPYLGEDLRARHARLAALSPSTVWLCSRPRSGDWQDQSSFLQHVQALLQDWAARGALRRLVVFSTQLVVDTPASGERATGATPLAPHGAYDCAKAQLEVFAGYLARAFGLSVDVVRLPLLWGGELAGEDGEHQFLAYWRAALAAGRRWDLGEGDAQYGNSWAHVGDLVQALLPDPGPGLRVRSASSGDFTYAGLQRAWAGGEPGGEALHLPRTRFLMADELGLPPRQLA